MRKVFAQKIDEYKFYNNVHYVHVKWSDGLSCWTKLSNLSSKKLISEFLNRSITILRDEQKAEQEKRNKEREEMLLKQIYSNNLEESAKMESNNLKMINKMVNEVSANISKSSLNSDSTFANVKSYKSFDLGQTKQAEKVVQDIQRLGLGSEKKTISVLETPLTSKNASFDLKIGSEKPKLSNTDLIKSKSASNWITFQISSNFLIKKHFFMHELQGVIELAGDRIQLISVKNIYATLYSIFLSTPYKISFYPTVDVMDPTSVELEKLLIEHSVALIGRSTKHIWILMPVDPTKTYFSRNFSKSKFLIVKLESSVSLNLFAAINPENKSFVLWSDLRFKNCALNAVERTFDKHPFASYKKVYIIADTNSIVGKRLYELVKNIGAFTENIAEADCILVQESCFDIASGFFNLATLPATVRIFMQKGLEFNEIYPQGGILALNPNKLKDIDLLLLADLVEATDNSQEWQLKSSSETLEVIKKRLQEENVAKNFPVKMKTLFRIVKDSVDNSIDFNDVEALKLAFLHTARHFYILANVEESDSDFISIEDALKLINKNTSNS